MGEADRSYVCRLCPFSLIGLDKVIEGMRPNEVSPTSPYYEDYRFLKALWELTLRYRANPTPETLAAFNMAVSSASYLSLVLSLEYSQSPDDDRTGLGAVIMTALAVMSEVYDAALNSPGEMNAEVGDALYTLWPDVFRWISIFLPTKAASQDPPVGLRDACDCLFIVARTYRAVFQSGDPRVRHFLEDHADILQPFFEVWLNCASYPSTSPGNRSDETIIPYNFTLAAIALHNCLFGPSSDHTKMIFVTQLNQMAPDTRGLYRLFVRQANHLVRLPAIESTSEVLYQYFLAIAHIIRQPQFPRTGPCPRRVIAGFIDAGQHCLSRKETYGAACHITFLLSALCEPDADNRTLQRLIEGGAFDLLVRIGKLNVEGDVTEFSTRLSIAMCQPTILRVFHRRHGREYYTGRHPRALKTAIDHNAVVRVYQTHIGAYKAVRERSHWKHQMPCANTQIGPHNETVRGICPCGGVYFCSGSCQRLHWQMGHRQKCDAAQGPLRLRGAMSLNDVVYICTDVYAYIAANRKTLSSQVTTQLIQDMNAGAMTEAVIMGDLTRIFPNDVYEVYTRPVNARIRPRTVLIEIKIQMGGAPVRRMLPFKLDISYFISSMSSRTGS
ncbi:hypothetical protein BD626DRAFT_259520 [Schizophyllum amplum]|uniref:MYND-type domain-containing protein n=1 Tax=Schizophyllum amplum TaxID=97359 RepID=A0A550BUH3_9AGAR|nr:hypothetical protein BD626DRAFT_259520 [Auriculariopsis ampla]